MSGHSLTCQRCGRPFTARRSDARYCSRSCRRRAVAAPERIPSEADYIGGWRRVPSGLVAPPPAPRLTFRVD
jgi:hypothetical protein